MPKGVYDRKSFEEILNESIDIQDSGCWFYNKKLDKDGYGRMTMKKKCLYAHRITYTMYKGDIPEDKVISHLCDKNYPPDSKEYRKCCNPDHLVLATNQENIQRAYDLGRLKAPATAFKKGECSADKNVAARLTWPIVREIRAKVFKHGEMKPYAESLGITMTHLRNIINNKTWKE